MPVWMLHTGYFFKLVYKKHPTVILILTTPEVKGVARGLLVYEKATNVILISRKPKKIIWKGTKKLCIF